jgi:hypothetical protein
MIPFYKPRRELRCLTICPVNVKGALILPTLLPARD